MPEIKVKSRIQALEIKALKRVNSITRIDIIRNDSGRDTKFKSWLGQLLRMQNTKPVKSITGCKTQKRTKSRPISLDVDLVQILHKTGFGKMYTAKNEKLWGKFIYIQ